MALKRKRSLENFSPESNASTFSFDSRNSPSPTPAYQTIQSIATLDGSCDENAWPVSRGKFAWQMSGRTLKRHRDNRPSEEVIHENTIHKLYEAQRRDLNAQPVPIDTSLGAEASLPSMPQKSTLHSFWRLPTQSRYPALPMSQSPSTTLACDAQCEDCDSSLVPADAMDVDVDGQDMGHACRGCQRKVCDTCAVITEQRLCLQCAGNSGR